MRYQFFSSADEVRAVMDSLPLCKRRCVQILASRALDHRILQIRRKEPLTDTAIPELYREACATALAESYMILSSPPRDDNDRQLLESFASENEELLSSVALYLRVLMLRQLESKIGPLQGDK